ncbi:MAG: hypothetical protein V2I36_09840 [Desulfopila sp.]|nr:hypothetical protein [Desulfopila sp.]
MRCVVDWTVYMGLFNKNFVNKRNANADSAPVNELSPNSRKKPRLLPRDKINKQEIWVITEISFS